mmetsp:Transcript_533/g.1102  ORF Transcript_533/g.1102 Transcript_533/m.1102 type:complete len:153 (-) Transcript_533:1262-1720(-)
MAKGKFRRDKKDVSVRRELAFEGAEAVLKEEVKAGLLRTKGDTKFRNISNLKIERKRLADVFGKTLKRDKNREIKGLLKKMKVRPSKCDRVSYLAPSASEENFDVDEELEKLSSLQNIRFSPRTPASSPLSFRNTRSDDSVFQRALEVALRS